MSSYVRSRSFGLATLISDRQDTDAASPCNRLRQRPQRHEPPTILLMTPDPNRQAGSADGLLR